MVNPRLSKTVSLVLIFETRTYMYMKRACVSETVISNAKILRPV